MPLDKQLGWFLPFWHSWIASLGEKLPVGALSWSRVMFKHTVRTLLLALPLATATASAYAGVTISDRRYWPNEARQSAHELSVPQDGGSSAFALIPMAPPGYSFAPSPSRRVWGYQRARNSR